MTEGTFGGAEFARLRNERERLSEEVHALVRDDPDRTRGYTRAEEMRAWHQSEVGRYADDKEDILLAASEERGAGPTELAELAGGVTRQLTSRALRNARARRSDLARAETGEETA